MPETRGMKRSYIAISSSSSEKEDRSEDESDGCYDNDDASTSCHDDESGIDEEGDESDDQENEDTSDLKKDESLCNGVTRLLREKSDLEELSLKDCKSYLRRHGLRISGTKVECIQRIREHWRIKDGNAEALYPRSSFAINCTGDVCKGDIVLFRQRIHKKFDKASRRGSFIGKRIVAGKVVKESYGAAKQQHTFTIEVIWSKGIKKLPPLFPLLVKGRNLYKLNAFRQHWKNETERLEVLAEKHKRGAAARLVREMTKTKKACSSSSGVKRQKQFHHARPSHTGKKAQPEKAKNGDGKFPPVASKNDLHKNPNLRHPEFSRRHQNLTHTNNSKVPITPTYNLPPQNFRLSQMQFHHNQLSATLPFPGYVLPFPGYVAGFTSSAVPLPHSHSSVIPLSQHQGLNHGAYLQPTNLHLSHVFEPGMLNPCLGLMNRYGPSIPSSIRKEMHGQRKKGF